MTGDLSTPPRGLRLREAHAHLPMLGRSLSMLRLGDCVSREECIERVAAEASRGGQAVGSGGDEAWVLGVGVRAEAWPDPRWPTREELDRAAGGRPCVIMSFDHHSVAASTAAMRAAGIGDGDADPEGGVIVRDPATGRPTGLLLESAAMRVWHAAPEPGASERPAIIRAALQHLSALGFAEVHDLLAPDWLGPVLAGLHDRGELPLSVSMFAPMDRLSEFAASAPGWTRTGRVVLAGGKLFADGTINSRTAWMLDPFRDPLPGHERGTPLLTVAQMHDALAACQSMGLGLAVHAIGDGAVRAVLDARREHLKRGGGDARATPLRIEHAEFVDAADVPRFAELSAIASVQPCHLLADIEGINRLLPHRRDRVLPIRDLIDAGLEPGRTLIFGSDVPIVRADPGDSIVAAVERRREGMPASAAIAPEQAIAPDAGWRAFAAAE